MLIYEVDISLNFTESIGYIFYIILKPMKFQVDIDASSCLKGLHPSWFTCSQSREPKKTLIGWRIIPSQSQTFLQK